MRNIINGLLSQVESYLLVWSNRKFVAGLIASNPFLLFVRPMLLIKRPTRLVLLLNHIDPVKRIIHLNSSSIRGNNEVKIYLIMNRENNAFCPPINCRRWFIIFNLNGKFHTWRPHCSKFILELLMALQRGEIKIKFTVAARIQKENLLNQQIR